MDTAKASSEAAVRHEAMLEALAFAAQRFLEQPSWVQNIDEILGRLGEAVGASRAYVLENRPGEPPTTVLRSFWLAPGVASSFRVGDELGFEDLERWVEILSRGEVVGDSCGRSRPPNAVGSSPTGSVRCCSSPSWSRAPGGGTSGSTTAWTNVRGRRSRSTSCAPPARPSRPRSIGTERRPSSARPRPPTGRSSRRRRRSRTRNTSPRGTTSGARSCT